MWIRFSGAMIAAFAIAAPAAAQSGFNGTWVIDAATAKLPDKPTVLSLSKGTYRCASCVPSYSIPADGKFHAVVNQPYFDQMAVAVAGPRQVKLTYKKNDKVVGVENETVSADGRTMMFDDLDYSAPNGQPQTTKGTLNRVKAGAAGSHALSGSWHSNKVPEMSQEALTANIKTDGKTFSFAQPSGYHFTATIGGSAVGIVGDQANTKAKITRAGPRTLVETDMRGGKVTSVMTMTLAPEGKSIAFVADNKVMGTTTRFTAHKK